MPPVSLLADALIKGTALLAALSGAATLLRRAPASVRHTVWGAGLAAVLALPLASSLIPWRLEILPARTLTAGTATAPRMATPTSATVTSPPGAALVTPADAPGETQAPPPSGDLRPSVPWFLGWDWARILLGMWLAGATLLLGHLVIGLMTVRRMARRGIPLDDGEWQALCRRLERQIGVARPVPVLMSPDTAIPVTWGLFHATIVLPSTAAGWSDERRRAVLLHELAHVRRRDLPMHLLGQLVCSVYWFHPLVWLAARRLRVESERASDDLVLDAGVRPSSYAADLLDIVRGVGRLRAPAVALPLAQRSEFEGRLLAILEPSVTRRSPGPWRSAVLAVAVAAVTVPLAAMRPAEASSERLAAVDQGTPATPRPVPVVAPQAEGPRRGRRAPEPPGEEPAFDPGAGPQIAPVPPDILGPGPMVYPDPTPVPQPGPAPQPQVWGGPTPTPPARAPRAHVAGSAAAQDRGAAVLPLIQALRDQSPSVRLAATQALAELEDARAVEP
ncbi:MAG TPA: M56 family metallopeptidase, partial [Gemmatimonadales bacterium]|nr:M56 family metallopeptidase [Gemmatimonadales bacterium]